MIDFSLSDDDRAVLDEVRREGLAGRKYTRYYDEHEEELSPDRLPEADGFRRLKGLVEGRGEGASGLAVLEMLMAIERTRADGVPLRHVKGRALGNVAVRAAGTPEQVERFANTTLAMAITEPGCGSDTKAIQTTAELDGDEWVLNGEKIFVTTGIRAGGVVVWATIDRSAGRAGIKSFVVLKGSPGFEITRKELKLGIRSSDTAAMVFRDCRIPRDHLLGGDEGIAQKGSGAYKGVLKTFNMSRPGVAAGGIGYARGAADLAAEKLAEEGVEIDWEAGRAGRGALAQRLVEVEADVEAATLTVLRAAWLAEQGEPNNVEASVAKLKGGDVSRTAVQGVLEVLGNEGLSREHGAEKRFRDARITDIYEGTGQIQRLIIARAILGYSSSELS